MARCGRQTVLAGVVLLVGVIPIAAERAAWVPCAVRDVQDRTLPGATHFDGLLGTRLAVNAENRLATIDEPRLLDGFRHRPGRQAWEGEHVGKWLDAATLAWDYTGDPRLRNKLDRVATELGQWQLEDGYLGTYLPGQRWTEWDVWAHKYDMLGLLTYCRFTGNTEALKVSARCGDLLCRTFGTQPGQHDLLQAGWHVGMAPTSVLEPMVLLYRLTGEPRYLEFCRYILARWESPDGPRIVSTLLTDGRVDRVGNAKGYEMLSCLNGLLEFYRTTGEEQLLETALRAWQDIVDKRLYITGTATYGEHFHDDHDLPNSNARVAETCVTVTWIQFNAQLLRLTGECRFADALERSVYNQLFGAQQPDGRAWGYYVALEGRKRYSDRLAGHCCLSSGPRGVALIPTFAVTTDAEGIVVNLFSHGHSTHRLPDGTTASVNVTTEYPWDGQVRLELNPRTARDFELKLRIPSWSEGARITINGRELENHHAPGEYAVLKRRWSAGDVVDLNIPMVPKLWLGEHGNAGAAAWTIGPMVLAADDAVNPVARIGRFRVPTDARLTKVSGQDPAATEPRLHRYRLGAVLTEDSEGHRAGECVELILVPFAEAGSSGELYQVWLPLQPAERAPADPTRGGVNLNATRGHSG